APGHGRRRADGGRSGVDDAAERMFATRAVRARRLAARWPIRNRRSGTNEALRGRGKHIRGCKTARVSTRLCLGAMVPRRRMFELGLAREEPVPCVAEVRVPYGPAPRLLDRVRIAIRTRHLSPRTEDAYVFWIRRFIPFHRKRHPAEMAAAEVTAFLSNLAVEGRVAASTQNQALCALLFLYRHVLGTELPWLDDLVRAKRPARLPVVLTREEVAAILQHLQGVKRLAAALLYGSGLRLLECLRLRVKDLDLARHEIIVRAGKG